MRTALLVLAAAVTVALTGCGSEKQAAAPSPSPSLGADACHAYDNALKIYHEGLGPGGVVPATLLLFSTETAEQIRTAARLAQGAGRAAMEDTATRVEVLRDKARFWDQPGFGDSVEIQAVRDSITRVAGMCQVSGASLVNVPQ